jgi:hypothetical protein
MTPIIKYVSCPKCIVQSKVDCLGDRICSDRLYLFREKATLIERLEMQEFSFSNMPPSVKSLCLQERDSLWLDEEEYKIWLSTKENQEDIAYLKKNLFESLKVPKEFLKENEE